MLELVTSGLSVAISLDRNGHSAARASPEHPTIRDAITGASVASTAALESRPEPPFRKRLKQAKEQTSNRVNLTARDHFAFSQRGKQLYLIVTATIQRVRTL
jgi:hypothetical protein